jgi:hypothetical protein
MVNDTYLIENQRTKAHFVINEKNMARIAMAIGMYLEADYIARPQIRDEWKALKRQIDDLRIGVNYLTEQELQHKQMNATDLINKNWPGFLQDVEIKVVRKYSYNDLEQGSKPQGDYSGAYQRD